MNLKNYTSGVAASRSIEQIEKRLIKMGAKNINKEYNNETLVGITFLIDVKGNTVAFKLPANTEAVYKVFWLEVKREGPETKKKLQEQAERTAWKIIADWVDVQASMVYLEQAEVMQVFLPYALMKGGETVYETMKSNGLKALTAGT